MDERDNRGRDGTAAGEAPATFSFQGFSVPVDLALRTGGGPDNFQAIADFHQALLRRRIDLQPSDSILEIGSGIGRDAIPISRYLTTGSYLGVDIIRPSIDWCVANISAKTPAVRFVHFDIRDDLHNPAGTLETKDVVFPVETGSIDKIFLFSVFTHMFRDEIEHYLVEFRRVLRPTGLVYATIFVYSDEVLEAARRTNLTPWSLRFEHEWGAGCRINDLGSKRGAVAYTPELVDTMISSSGMKRIGPVLKGAWSGFYPQADDGQDAIVLMRDSARG